MNRYADEAAMQVDTYLDELLATRSRSIAAVDDASAELALAAAAVRGALVRFHPSFRFEEELAARLRAVAAGALRAAAIVRFPAPTDAASSVVVAGPGGAARAPDPGPGLPTGEDVDPDRARAPGERGWVLVGGAIASGVSLAAGVLIARRRSRGDPRWERLV